MNQNDLHKSGKAGEHSGNPSHRSTKNPMPYPIHPARKRTPASDSSADTDDKSSPNQTSSHPHTSHKKDKRTVLSSRLNDIDDTTISNDMQQSLLPVIHRRSRTIKEHLKKSHSLLKARALPSKDVHIDVPESEEDTEKLLNIIRGLPFHMSEKIEYREELKLAAGSPATRSDAYYAQYAKIKHDVTTYISNVSSKLDWWSSAFKAIEGHFGTGVVSYFVFLKWLLTMNLTIFFINLFFIIIPQGFGRFDFSSGNSTVMSNMIITAPEKDRFDSVFKKFITATTVQPKTKSLSTSNSLIGITDLKLGVDFDTTDKLGSYLNTYVTDDFLDFTLFYSPKNFTIEQRANLSKQCAIIYQKLLYNASDRSVASKIQDFFQGTGWMEYTLLFTGFYKPASIIIGTVYYNIGCAFVLVLFVLVFICIIMIVTYASKGVKESLLGNSLQELYCYMIFCGWDYCIEDEKTAIRQQSNIKQDLMSTLIESHSTAEREAWKTMYKAKIYLIRCLVNLGTILVLIAAYYLMFYVAEAQLREERTSSSEGVRALFLKFMPPLTITSLNFILPQFLYVVVKFEQYKQSNKISMVLIRVILLRQASILILVTSFYNQLSCEPKDMCAKGMLDCPSPICWETYVGQQTYRLVLTDLIVNLLVVFVWDTSRKFIVMRWQTKLTKLIGRQVFDIPIHVLGLVYSQTLCWLGMFYCPFVPMISSMNMVVFFYIKKYTVLHNCVPETTPYKASKSNVIFALLLMLSFFVTVFVLGYSITQIRPSPGCSPFHFFDNIVDALYDAVHHHSPRLNNYLHFMFSPLVAVPIFLLLSLAVYYYVTKASAHKRMIKFLKVQLAMEGKDRKFLLEKVTKIKPKSSPS